MMTCCILKDPFPAELCAWRVIDCGRFYTKGAVPQRGAKREGRSLQFKATV
jgi:hypothetical protein